MALSMPYLDQAVAKAESRAAALHTSLQGLTDRVRDSTPAKLNSDTEKQQRRQFLESLYDESHEAEQAYERIINGNELQPANFLPRGAIVSNAIVRVVIRSGGGRIIGYGTGFLVGDGVLITNNHVLQNADAARESKIEAHFQFGLAGEDEHILTFALDPDRLYYTSKDLDFTIVAVAPETEQRDGRLADIGWLPLIGTVGKAVEGEWLTIIQHPNGERKQLCVRENQLIKIADQVLWYSTDTLGGSSGSPVFNNDWLVVALHHSGVPVVVNGKWQTVDGRDYDPQHDDESRIKWQANEGIRVSRIVNMLRTDKAIAAHPMVVAMLDVGVEDISARLPIMTKTGAPRPPAANLAANLAAPIDLDGADPGPAYSRKPSTEAQMGTHLIHLTLAVADDGTVSVRDQSATEAAMLEATGAPKKKKNIIHAPVDPARDWVGGYSPHFLTKAAAPDDDLIVNLPDVVDTTKIAPLVRDRNGKKLTSPDAAGVLEYKGYSVVMNKDRRFAFFSAANLDGGMRPNISGRDDNWLFDDRISRDHQVGDNYYKNDKFDRGHLTRRDDMEWGTDVIDAVNRANGTCTWTNCSPQHEIFNQGKDKDVLLWQNLERYILEQTAAANQFKVQVITGPIFGDFDPLFRDIPYPLEFWKVVAAVSSKGKLFATGYILGQKDTIAKFGLEAALETPFGAFGTYQRPISLIENFTGLKFTYGTANKRPLSGVDPLAKPSWRPRPRPGGAGPEESFGVQSGDDALESFDDIVLV